MIKRNPYLNRSMVRSLDGFFGRRRELDRAMARLGDATPQSVSVVGERRVGKSSFLWHLAQPEVQARYLDDAQAHVFVYIDFQGQRHLDLSGFSRVFSRQLAEAAAGRASVEEAADLGALERCVQGLCGQGLRIVGLFDEFETVTGSAVFGGEFFGFLRSLANSYPVAYVTASRRDLQALCRSQEIAESPFFNIFSRVVLGPLEEAAATQLIVEPSAAAGLPLAAHAEELSRLGGHLPLFLQMACSAAFECLQEADSGELDAAPVTRRFREEADAHLEYLWEHLPDQEREALEGLLSGREPRNEPTPGLRRLEETGHVQRVGGGLRPFSSCLGPWLAEHGRLAETPLPPEPETEVAVDETGPTTPLSHELFLDPVPSDHCPFPDLIGGSVEMRRLTTFIERAAASDVTVLLLGETGTGKELVARAIHEHSARRDSPLVVVNCGAIAEHLQESELFGHRKGSFTGAIADHEGLFEAASGGTLLLDEIGETTPATQVKLLRVLQEKEVRRVGETHNRPVDVRVIGATNSDPAADVEAKRFRGDLYYRLCVLVARLPPLRDRPQDIDLLVDHFLDGATVSPEVLEHLRAHDWPGNIRELQNQLASAMAVAAGEEIAPRHLWPQLQQLRPRAGGGPQATAELAPTGWADMSLREARDAFERELLLTRLQRFDWEHMRVATSLGISRSRLYELVRKHGLNRPADG